MLPIFEKLSAVKYAAVSIFILFALSYLFQYIEKNAPAFIGNLFKCGSIATCSLVAQILLFTTIYILIPQEWLEKLFYLYNPSQMIKKSQ